MVKSRRVNCIIHVHFGEPYKSEADVKTFTERLKKYIELEVKKIPQLRLTQGKLPLMDVVETTNNQLKIGMSKEFIDIMIKGNDVVKELNAMDKLLNRVMNFLNVSEHSVNGVYIHYSKVLPISNNPVGMFFDKSAVADFNIKNKKSFYPSGAVLTSKTEESELTVMLEQQGRNVFLEINQDLMYVSVPLDVLKQSNETVNKTKALLLDTLEVSEK